MGRVGCTAKSRRPGACGWNIKGVTFDPVNHNIALQSVNLPGAFRPDPADRTPVVTARHLDATMITGDAKIHSYPHVKTSW